MLKSDFGAALPVAKNPPNEQKPNLWDALPVAKMLIYKHLKADAPNIYKGAELRNYKTMLINSL